MFGLLLKSFRSDIAKSKFDCAVRLNNGKYKDKVFNNESEGFSTFINWLAHHGFSHVHICMEATGIYWLEARPIGEMPE
ncbi:IS110 family transposase [Xenorhabdus cabanillasii]|uniref:IS110 family transposase n=1 Tax=Xenorhabdus cabanillasii TaxID=351673 RepID=UPI000C0604E0|nr:transposase [Xenorhabdus cabanillasii JM26]